MVSSKLRNYKKKRNTLFNFSCVYCGDSQKNKLKARGYLYEKKNKLNYSCHNCGCNHSFSHFLKHIDPALHKEYMREKFMEKRGKKLSTPIQVKSTTPTFKPKPVDLLRRMVLVMKMPRESMVIQYLIGRKIPESQWHKLYYIPKMESITRHIELYKNQEFDLDPRLVLPYINKDGIITHVQGRSLTNKGLRYYTLTIDDSQPKVYGLDYIDINQPVNVVEGPIDSLFINNCLAMGGASVDLSGLDAENTTFIFDNESRNPEIIKRMKTLAIIGFGICVWTDRIKEKDINDMILAGRSEDYLTSYIRNNTFRGVHAQMAIKKFSKV